MNLDLDLETELSQYGAAGAVRHLDEKDPEVLMRYVDLLPSSVSRKRRQGVPLPDAVVEHEGRPLIYAFRSDRLAEAPDVRNLHDALRSLACRGDGAYAAIVSHGVIEIYPVALLDESPAPQAFQAEARNKLLIHDLAHGRANASLRQQLAMAKSLHQTLLDLFLSVANALRACRTLSFSREEDHILPLLGRALFTRFLVDRGIINESTFPQMYTQGGTPEECFSTPERAATTCAWLDQTFNGDLLTLLHGVDKPRRKHYLEFFQAAEEAGGRPLFHLGNIMHRAVDGHLTLDLGWQGVDFAHVPIGLLSEVYEHYAHEYYKDDALRESVWYTPRHIAEFTVEHAFMGLPPEKRMQARVLDPAAGAGVFLVLALQRLVAERFDATKKRPDTHEIREILYTQIRGFDINQSALTLAALSLYLVALELDPEPFPPEKLSFKRLMDHVLLSMRKPEEKFPFAGIVLGSLGKPGDIGRGQNRFDIVVGNPPWTELGKWKSPAKENFNGYAREMVQGIVAAHRPGNEHLAEVARRYRHNDNLPDVAFLWRAIEWARPGGVIALILAARLLFKRGKTGAGVREALFQALHVTGVLNGACVQDIWPRLSQPFCIVVARNEPAPPGARFTMVTPLLDTNASSEPQMRIDAEARQPIDLAMLLRERHLLKALTRGSRLDLDVLRRMMDQISRSGQGQRDSVNAIPSETNRVADYFRAKDGTHFGQGYIPGNPGKKQIARVEELLRLNPLHFTSDDLKDAKGHIRVGLRVDPRLLKPFERVRAYRIADPSLFQPPLVLIKEGFGESARGGRARLYLGKRPMVFRRNFYGFSCGWHPKPELLAKYLFCILNSDLLEYYTLHTSSKFGYERRTLLLEDLENFPMLPLETLTPQQEQTIEEAADGLDLDEDRSWTALNRAVNRIYGLTPADEQVIRDALETKMPYASAMDRALEFSERDVRRFVDELKRTLSPFFGQDAGEDLSIERIPLATESWVGVEIHTGGKPTTELIQAVTAIAEGLAREAGASRIVAQESRRLVVAIYKQYRFLTASKARLLAIDVLRDYDSAFPLHQRSPQPRLPRQSRS